MRNLPAPRVVDVEDLDLDDLETADKRALAWARVMRGETKTVVARSFNVSRQTMTKWIDLEARRRRSLCQDIDVEVEKVIGQLEQVVTEAWQAHAALGGSNAMVGPQYLRLVIDGVKEIARYRGLDKPADSGTRKPVEVKVVIGGDAGRPAIGMAVTA